MSSSLRGWVVRVGAALWVVAVAALFVGAGQYRGTVGEPAQAPSQWPAELPFAPSAGQTTVVMLAHPRCPCTRASLDELDRLMAEVGDRATAYVLFVRPPGVAAAWEQTDTWTRAHRIPHTQVRVDEGGAESARLGALTSGQVVAFDSQGQLVFSGGITAGRGHEGDNAGHARLREIILGGQAATAPGPVFGCPLSELSQRRGDGT